MGSRQQILSIVCFLAAYSWAREHSTVIRNIEVVPKVVQVLSAKERHHKPVYSLVTSYEPRVIPAAWVLTNVKRKTRMKRYADEGAYPDPETFIKLLELAKAVSSVVPSNKNPTKFRSLDTSEAYPSRPVVRKTSNNRRGMSWRSKPEDDYEEEVTPQWKRRDNPEPPPVRDDQYEY